MLVRDQANKDSKLQVTQRLYFLCYSNTRFVHDEQSVRDPCMVGWALGVAFRTGLGVLDRGGCLLPRRAGISWRHCASGTSVGPGCILTSMAYNMSLYIALNEYKCEFIYSHYSGIGSLLQRALPMGCLVGPSSPSHATQTSYLHSPGEHHLISKLNPSHSPQSNSSLELQPNECSSQFSAV